MDPYSQSDHDEAVATGCLILFVAVAPFIGSLIALAYTGVTNLVSMVLP